MSLLETFERDGYVILKGIVDLEIIPNLREQLLADVGYDFIGNKTLSYFLTCPKLYKYQFHPRIVEALVAICGPRVYYINDIDLRFNRTETSGPQKGWHIDAGSELARFVPYLFDKKYKFMKVGIYLQNNSFEYGGGIDVIVGGHKSFRNFGSRVRNLIAYFVDNWALAMFRKKIQVPINAGDCVIFDSRIPHRSSPATAKNGSLVSVERSKIVLYWDVAGRLDDAKNFILNSTVRAVTESDSFESFSYLGHNFPDSYPPEYIDLVGSVGPIVIAGPESNNRRFFQIDKC